MEIRSYVASVLYRRPWLGVLLGVWAVLSMVHYWRAVGHIDRYQAHKGRVHPEPEVRVLLEKDVQKPWHLLEPLCSPIQLSLVCMGKCGRQLTPMLKSLLQHRQNPLHFHVVVDTHTKEVISKLFHTWDLPDVRWSTYNAEPYLRKVAWIPNSHYSGVYSFLKLMYPALLPATLDQVIVLDTDLTFLTDVRELWDLFQDMSDAQFLGLVENESNWYRQEARWPARGRGFNTGVMLIHLRKMRRAGWAQMWQEALHKHIGRLKKTSLGDQDIINAVIKENPDIVLNISCRYNVQLSAKSLAKDCYGNDVRNVKIIHWNSPLRHIVNQTDVAYMRSVHRSYSALDGALLTHKLRGCWPAPPAPETNDSYCKAFRAAEHKEFRTHIYYFDYNFKSRDPFDVSLVLQLSIDRAAFLVRLAERWEGPISAAIYLADCDVNKFEHFVQDWSPTLSARTNIGYHLVYRQDMVHYPVNYLRNVALAHVNTPYVFLMDVDFVPMDTLYTQLRDALRLTDPYPQKKVLVVAAFETQLYRAAPPRTKAALLSRWRAPGDVAPFRAREWPRGHRATNYSRWATATAPYEVEWEADYEPYLVVHRSVPKYDTRFSGFGWNKVSHAVELRARGYRAVVLPAAFVVHTTHAPSADITAFRANADYRICLALLKKEFLEDLKRKYNFTYDAFERETPYQAQAEDLLLNQVPDLDTD